MTFRYNDVLISEIPYACVVKYDAKDKICCFCFKQSSKLHKCSQCDLNSYCNKDCQRKDWKQHKLECKSFAVNEFRPNDISLLILRIISKNKTGADCQPCGITSNKYGFKPRCFNDLVSNLDDDESNIHKDFESMMFELREFLLLAGMHISEFVSIEAAKIVFAKCLTNNFEIQNDISTTIGYGCYLNGSGFNHSCWPNSVYHFSGNQLVLRALKDIAPTDKVYINYTDPLQLRADRRARLREQYLFECQCDACSSDQLEREMSELPCAGPNCDGFATVMAVGNDFQCNSCGLIELGAAVATRHSIHKAKLFHINNLMIDEDYRRSYELALRELREFHLDSQKQSYGGLYQLCYGEKAFESAIFLGDYESALNVSQMKSKSSSWIYERLVRFLGTENHPIAKCHWEKYQRLIEFCA